MENKRGELVCVTGGSGFIGSWLVKLLLHRGYTVHATVKNLEDEKETKHLEAMEGAESRLRLFQMDLLNYDSIVVAVHGAAGVFHLASPCIVEVHDPQGELLDPAIKGTLNVLKAAKEVGVGRVVLTSSVAALFPSPKWAADVVKNEDCWTDEEYCRQKELWYPLSKTLAEKVAWKFAEENDLDVVVVNPGTVMGTIIPPVINATSMVMILRLLQGNTEEYEDHFVGIVHVKDVALAHILVYDNKSATGRHLCVEAISHYADFAAKVAELYPEYNVPRFPKDTQPGLLRSKDASKKLINLGLEFIPMDQIIKDTVESLKIKGYLS